MTGETVLGPPFQALLCVGGQPERWTASVKALCDNDVAVVALIGPGTVLDWPEPYKVATTTAPLAQAVDQLVADGAEAVLVAWSPVVAPLDPFGPALAAVGDDRRVATVSFLSNSASYLSFPDRNAPVPLAPNGHNEITLTRALRALPPQPAVPLPAPAGGAVLVAGVALRAVGGLDPTVADPALAVTDFALRARRRGFANLLDPTTYLTRPAQPGDRPDPIDVEAPRAWLEARHAPEFPGLYDQEHVSETAPVGQVLAFLRAGVEGLTVAFDGSALGRYQMGTQVATLGQLQALADDPRISRLYVGTTEGRIPDYARPVLGHPKITVIDERGGQFPSLTAVDIVHRPFQPSGRLPLERWRQLGRRVFITIQDLIAYDNGHYFGQPAEYLGYRRHLRQAVGQVDAVVAISHDTAAMIRRARLPIADQAVYVIENGADHLRPTADPTPPPDLLAAGWAARPFIVVLGADYAHKNRDLAIRAWQELRRRGSDLELVLAGAIVPLGSSRQSEARAAMTGPGPLTLADVTEAERDWLLSHAQVVCYPTSAEGFGLVPFEAAVFDTPTVFVGFGPLAELLGDIPVTAADWTPAALADAITALSQPELARRQVEAVRAAAARLTWRRYADRLIAAYLDSLSRPSLRPDPSDNRTGGRHVTD
ncbi:MAG: glycosyltransferase [Propionibacteriaceae bacterium]|nr:glycosyltransferase [Propionibacteriaceae bacterium]